MATQVKEKSQVVQPQEVAQLQRKPLPKSMGEAAGLLKRNYNDLKRHYRKIREEWPSYGA